MRLRKLKAACPILLVHLSMRYTCFLPGKIAEMEGIRRVKERQRLLPDLPVAFGERWFVFMGNTQLLAWFRFPNSLTATDASIGLGEVRSCHRQRLTMLRISGGSLINQYPLTLASAFLHPLGRRFRRKVRRHLLASMVRRGAMVFRRALNVTL
jgi:hypothetical protein